MPAEALPEGAHRRPWQPPKRNTLDVAILHVVADLVLKDVIDESFVDDETRVAQQAAHRFTSVGVGHRATGLCFGVARYGFVQTPECPVRLSKQDGEDL